MFITIEGCDGAGKSTQAKDLAKRIANLGLEVVRTREPGGTPLGEQLRGLQGWLKVGESVSVLAEICSRPASPSIVSQRAGSAAASSR